MIVQAETAPYRVSGVHGIQEKLGATWVERNGSKIAERFGDSRSELEALRRSAGLCDLSHRERVEFRGEDLDPVLARLLGIASLPQPGRGIECSFGLCLRLAPDRVLLCAGGAGFRPHGSSGPPDADEAVRSLAKDSGGCMHATIRSSGLAHFLLAGPQGVAILNRLTSLDLRERSFPDLSCARAPLARVNATVVRRNRPSVAAYEIMVGREVAEYVWRAVLETGEPFGIQPCGDEACRELES
jgi:aminomethyltransferase